MGKVSFGTNTTAAGIIVPEGTDLSGLGTADAAKTSTGVQLDTKPVVAGELPVSGGAKVAAPALLTVSQAKLNKVPLFELVPGRYPDAYSLVTLLNEIGSGPAGAGVAKALAAEYEKMVGKPLNPAYLGLAASKPAALLDALAVTVEDLASGINAINLAAKAKAAKAGGNVELPPKERKLPQSFDVAKLASAPHVLPDVTKEWKELVPGQPGLLFQGDLPNPKLSDAQGMAQAKVNMAMAEAIDRLAENASSPKKDQFHLTYKGKSFTRIDAFMKALVKDGYQVDVTVDHRIANFANLKTKRPDGTIMDVPAALMVKTGFFDEKGEQAIVPSTHSELTISIRKGPNNADGFDADLKWFQGISGTGFFAGGLTATPSWCGRKIADTYSGQKAVEAMELAGLMGDVINKSAKAQHLAVGGYGVTGVCNDSVAIIQQAMSGHATAYPLVMRDETLASEFHMRISDKDTFDDKRYQRLIDAVAIVPRDDIISTNLSIADAKAVAEDRKLRAKYSIPYQAGQEPFYSTEQAGLILAS